jgi:hypothetical protein
MGPRLHWKCLSIVVSNVHLQAVDALDLAHISMDTPEQKALEL